MPSTILATSGKKKFIDGYTDDVRQAGPNHLCPPSTNVDISKTGEAIYRKGFTDTAINLAEAAKVSRPFHVAVHNVTFFAINGKVKFVNHNASNAVVDTGLSLTETDGTKTAFGEFAGDIYLTNQTDGLRQIHMGKMNDAAATAGDATITIDQNLAARLIAFGDTTSSLRIANATPIAESMASIAVTGVVTLSNTLDANVADNTICYTVEDISSGRPKGSGITFWKERMIIWGVIDDQNTYNGTAVDNCSNVVYMSAIAIRETIENIIVFDTSTTAAIEQVGKGGTVTEVLSTRDYLYYFTQGETYFSGVEDMNQATGMTIPQLLSNQYGCIQHCAADLGNGLVAFLTNNHRIIGIRISTETGAPVVFPDESFDVPLTNTLALLDSDQSDSFFFYAPNDRRLFAHCNIDSTRIVLKYNNQIQRWEPPTTGWSFSGMYVNAGITYATDLTEDTIYQTGDGFQDAGQDFEVNVATALIEAEDGRRTLELKDVGISGQIGALTTITVENVVGGGTAQQKSFTASGSVSGSSLGSVALGTTTLGAGVGETMEEYDKLFAIYPRYGHSYQLRIRSLSASTSGAFTVSSYAVRGRVLGTSLLTAE